MKRIISVILTLAMLFTLFPASVYAAAGGTEALPEGASETAVFFDDINAAESVDGVEAFYFGSTNMSISEKDGRVHLMKICRGGAAEGDASVTVKFINYSAEYGRNYRLSLIGSDAEPVIENGAFNLSEFIAENASTLEEVPLISAGDVDGEGCDVSDDPIEDEFPGLSFKLDFGEGEKVKYIAVEALYEEGGDGDAMAAVVLEYPSENMGLWEDFTASLIIVNEDEQEEAVISLEKAEYSADGDELTVTLVRTGAMNDLASVRLYSVDGTAVAGDDYSGIDAPVQFAFGIDRREVTLTLNHRFSDRTVDFQLKLGSAKGCRIGEGQAVVTIAPRETEELAVLSNYRDGIIKFDDGSRISQVYLPADNPFSNRLIGNTWYTIYGAAESGTAGWDKGLNHGTCISLPNSYVYDGARVCLSTDEYQPFTYYHVLLGTQSTAAAMTSIPGLDLEFANYNMDFPCFKQSWACFDYYFDNVKNWKLYMECRLDRNKTNFITTFHYFQLYKRRFNCILVQADPLSYENVEPAVSDKYTQTTISGLSGSSVYRVLDESLSVSCAMSEHEYARLESIGFYEDAECTREVYRKYNDTNTRTITTKLDASVLTDEFCDGLTYINDGQGYIGIIFVKPRFTYIDCTVTVMPVEQVHLTGKLETGDTEKDVVVHMGDRLELESVVAEDCSGYYVPDGVNCQYMDAQGKLIRNGDVSYHYQDDSCSTQVTVNTQRMKLKPEYRSLDNSVVVKVRKSDIRAGYFVRNTGVFSMKKLEDEGEYECYRVSGVTVHTGEIVPMFAKAADGRCPVWTEQAGNRSYGGEVFFFTANRLREDNVIFLSTQPCERTDFSCYSLEGNLFAAEKNLTTGVSYDKNYNLPMSGGSIVGGSSFNYDDAAPVAYATAVSDEEGHFRIDELKGVPGQVQRMLIQAGGYEFVREYTVPADDGLVSIPVVDCPVNTPENAYISAVTFLQNGIYVNSSETLKMDGKKLEVNIVVQDGNRYFIGEQALREKTEKVEVLVIDGITKGVKSVYPAVYDETKKAWVVTVSQFSPEDEDQYTYGDIFCVRLTTDRRGADIYDDKGNLLDFNRHTTYPMISTGYQVVDDVNYKPLMFSMSPELAASVLMGPDDETIDLEDETREFAKIPFIGGLNAAVGCFGLFKIKGGAEDSYEESDGLDDDDDLDTGGTYDPSSGSNTKVSVRITCYFEELPTGVTRFHIGVTLTTGNMGYRMNSENPLETRDLQKIGQAWKAEKAASLEGKNKLIVDKTTRGLAQVTLSKTALSVSLAFGIYVDFGLVLTRNDAGEVTERTLEFIGIGGYVGGSLKIEKTLNYGCLYAGVEASLTAAVYFGKTRNPNDVIRSDVMTTGNGVDQDGNPVLDANAFHYDTSTIIKASLTGYGGVGAKNVFGARIYLSFNVAFLASDLTKEFYPQLTEKYGLKMSVELGGVVDAVVVSVPFRALRYPFLNKGYAAYFRVVEQAVKLNKICLDKLNEDGYRNYPYAPEIRQNLSYIMNLIDNGDNKGELVYCYNTTVNWLRNDIGFLSKGEYNSLQIETFTWTTLSGDDDFSVHKRVDSEWVADQSADLLGTFREKESFTLVRDSVSQPGADLISLGLGEDGNERLLMIYLDDDPEKSDTQIQTLMYSIYNCAEDSWTAPAKIQDDATGDFSPSLTDAGDKVFISWISGDPANAVSSIETSKDAADYARGTEVYGTFVSKSALLNAGDGTVSFDIDRITDDSIYDDEGVMDTAPSAVYDPDAGEAGQTFLFYLKNFSESGDISDFAYSFSNSRSVITYRIYDHASGRWLTEYYDGEMSFESDEERAEYESEWYGQRFLYGPVSGSDLPIYDISTCLAYKNHILFAFTVDMDGNTDDDADRELFVQLYDTAQHRLYYPIRVTEDDVSEAMPRLISNAFPHIDETDGELLDRSAYLFWVEDNARLKYIDVVDLIRHGLVLDGDGAVKDDYRIRPIPVPLTEEYDGAAQLSDYEVFTDNNNDLYVLRGVTVSDENRSPDEMPAKEIYASALIRLKDDEMAEQLEALRGVIGDAVDLLGSESDDPEAEPQTPVVLPVYPVSRKWSDPVRLTCSGKANDNISAAVAQDGRLFILHNQFKVSISSEAGSEDEDPFETGEIDLKLTVCEPSSSVEVTEFTLSDERPNPGDTVTVSMKLTNTGLTTAKGYEAEFCAVRDGVTEPLTPLPNNDGIDYRKVWLAPGDSHYYTFEWEVPAEFEGTVFRCEAQENGYANRIISDSDPVVKRAAYNVTLGSVTQDGETFTAEVMVENSGNDVSAPGDIISLELEGLYGSLQLVYGIDDRKLAECGLEELQPGERRLYSVDFSVPESVFDYCGYDQLDAAVLDAEGTLLADVSSSLLFLQEPLSFSANDGRDVTVGAGESFRPVVTDGNDRLDMYDTFILSSDDNSIATVENGAIRGVSAGSTTVRVRSALYGNETTLTVNVTGSDEEPEVVPEPVSAPEYPVSFAAEPENGTVRFSADSAPFGTRITLTPEPAEGYRTGSVSVTGVGGKKLDVSDNGGGSLSFLMPTGGAIVSAVFVKEAETPEFAFVDVPEDSYYADAVTWAVENGITTGTDKTHFSPDAPCTRAQMVTFLWRAAGMPEPVGTELPFVDVPAGSYYEKAVMWAVENGITNGTDKTHFSPDMTVTRAQTVTFLWRFAGAPAEAAKELFRDVPAGQWYSAAVTWAAENGITNGTGNGCFSPDADCVRAQTVTFLYRLSLLDAAP